MYSQWNASRIYIQIVLVCQDASTFEEFYDEMPWVAYLPDDPHVHQLMARYRINRLPSLLVLDLYGNILDADALVKIDNKGVGILSDWNDASALAPGSG